MNDFKALLTREKFILTLLKSKGDDDSNLKRSIKKQDLKDLQKALGNRLEITFTCGETNKVKKYIVRSQNVHTCLRIGSHVAYHLAKYGAIKDPLIKNMNWKKTFRAATDAFERKWNPDLWAAVYSDGKCLFKAGNNYQPLLEIVEECMSVGNLSYQYVIQSLEEKFLKDGHDVDISYQGEPVINIAGERNNAKINILKRAPEENEVIKIKVTPKKVRDISLSSCLVSSAAILEAFQLGFFAAKVNKKSTYLKLGLEDPDVRKSSAAAQRIVNMQRLIRDFETLYNVDYKPRAPNIEGFLAEIGKYFESYFKKNSQQKLDFEQIEENPPIY